MRSIALTVLLAVALGGCKVTSADIDYWTGTEKGPGKIVAVLGAAKYDTPLRTHAGLALVRMEPRENVVGVTELQRAVEGLPEDQRHAIVDGMVPELISMMRGADTPQADQEETIAPLQVRAKDAAFLLISHASAGESQRQLLDAIIEWFATDFNGRNLAGMFSAEVVVREFGEPAASRLVPAMNARLPQPALVKIAELVATLGDDNAKTAAGNRMVEIQREMETEEYGGWLRQQLQEQYPDAEEARINAGVEINREAHIVSGALPAMKHLNAQAVVQNRLLEMAQLPGTDEPTIGRRVGALQALEGNVRPDMVGALVTLALADSTPVGVSDYAFDRIADSRDASVVNRLWASFEQGEDWRLRWRVGTLILTLGGADVIGGFFSRMDDDGLYAQEELYAYGERLAAIRPPPDDVVTARLRSDEWYERVVAIFYWGRRAESEEVVARIRALASDAAATNGRPTGPNRERITEQPWEDQATVGAVATSVADEAQARVATQAAAAAEAAGNQG